MVVLREKMANYLKLVIKKMEGYYNYFYSFLINISSVQQPTNWEILIGNGKLGIQYVDNNSRNVKIEYFRFHIFSICSYLNKFTGICIK